MDYITSKKLKRDLLDGVCDELSSIDYDVFEYFLETTARDEDVAQAYKYFAGYQSTPEYHENYYLDDYYAKECPVNNEVIDFIVDYLPDDWSVYQEDEFVKEFILPKYSIESFYDEYAGKTAEEIIKAETKYIGEVNYYQNMVIMHR